MRKLVKYFGLITLVSLLTFTTMIPTQAASETNWTKKFSEPINLGHKIESIALYDSAYGVEDGRNVVYTTVSGEPAIFQVLDLETKELIRKFQLEGSSSSWTHITVPNGNVYIGGNGTLYEYSPETKEVRALGGIGESVVYGLSYDEKGRVYFGSYPNAKAGMYDPATGEFRDYGTVAPGQNYTRSTAYLDGYLYLGVGIFGSLAKVNVETGEVENIPLPDFADKDQTVWQLDAAGKYIVAGIGGGRNTLLFYDTETGEWSDKYYDGNKGLRLIKGKPGEEEEKAYFLQGTRLQEIDLNTLDIKDTGVIFGTFLRNTAWIEIPDDPDFPGLSLVTIQFGGQLSFMNLETKTVKTVTDYEVAGNPIPIQTLEKDVDGNLWVSGYPGGKGAAFNPETLENTMFTLGQAEGITFIEDKVYFGVYPGAVIHEADRTAEAPVARQIYQIPDQDRPFIMKAHEDTLYIGTIPNYGYLGGSLTIMKPGTDEEPVVYENVVHNQAIAGLEVLDGKLYGTTTVAGGLGIDPTETAAKIFVWDIEKGEKITEFVPDLPGATSVPRMISGIKLGPDGLLWAAADGNIFALDPDTLEIVKSKNIYPEASNLGRWRPVHLRWGADGYLYTTLGQQLTVIHPDTLESRTLARTELMVVGDDGHIYYTEGANIMKIEVSGEISLEVIADYINTASENGEIRHPLSKKLTNAIRQAIHHRDAGRDQQSDHHVKNAIKHLERSKPNERSEQAYNQLMEMLRQY